MTVVGNLKNKGDKKRKIYVSTRLQTYVNKTVCMQYSKPITGLNKHCTYCMSKGLLLFLYSNLPQERIKTSWTFNILRLTWLSVCNRYMLSLIIYIIAYHINNFLYESTALKIVWNLLYILKTWQFYLSENMNSECLLF